MCPLNAAGEADSFFATLTNYFTTFGGALALALIAIVVKSCVSSRKAANHLKEVEVNDVAQEGTGPDEDSYVKGQVQGAAQGALNGALGKAGYDDVGGTGDDGMGDMAEGVQEDAASRSSNGKIELAMVGKIAALLAKLKTIVGNKVKILLSYMQVITLFRLEMGGVKMPAFLDSFFGAFSVLSFDFLQFAPMGCADSTYSPFEITFSLYTYGALGATLFVYCFAVAAGKCAFKGRGGALASAERLWSASCSKWLGIIIFLQVLCSSVARTVPHSLF